jgi:hypothetical protein
MKTGITIGALLLTVSLLGFAPAASGAEDQEEVANPDLKCLKCHSKGLKKKLENGETLSLRIDGDAFSTSVHQVIGCTGCHRDVPKGKHPSRQPIESARAYSVKHNETCGQCHESNSHEYEGSIHARLVAEGDENAPVCSDCHSAHAIQPRTVYEPVSGEPCSKCHQEIYQAYAQSVHGEARARGNVIRGDHVQAPICFDCHKAHAVAGVASSDDLVKQCTSCHEVAKLAHEQWLPNASMHLQSVSCPACHSPDAERRIELQLYDRLGKVPVGLDSGHEEVQQRLSEIDSGKDGLDPFELWKLVRETSRDGYGTDVVLRGRMEVTTGVDAHRIAASGRAVRSCQSCHENNSEAFRNVTVSLSKPDGRKERYDANQKVLSSAISVDSVGGFYAPGGTRIKLLDGLLVLAILGGLAVPIGHITLGKLMRRKK